MSKGNCVYEVYVYVGGYNSHNAQVVYTTSKMTNAERFLNEYVDRHPEVYKAFIERSYGKKTKRNAKYMREDEEL